MRRVPLLTGLPLLLFAFLAVLRADPAKDTPLAEKTRTIKLKTKISLEIKNEMLREVMKEISGALEEKKAGSLSYRPENGVNMNARVTIVCKDKPVEEILDELFKPLNFGYYVVSKAGDRDDGWIHINTSPGDRGTKGGEEMAKDDKKDDKKKDAGAKKEEAKKKDDPKKKDASKDESDAASKLNLIKNYIDGKKADLARTKIKELLEKYPNTKAAEEAKALLEKLDK